MKIFFEIRKQKYLEALDRHDRANAVEILVKDLKVFSTFNEELYKEITQLLTLDNFWENEQLSKYGDNKSARSIMLIELKKLIEANPLFREVQDTQGGLVTTADQCSSIEEAIISVEAYGAGNAIDLAKLDGTWCLNYRFRCRHAVRGCQTPSLLSGGQIFQKFECRDRAGGGIVRNVVRWSIPLFLEEQEGATLLVSLKFSLLYKRHIYLQFEEVKKSHRYSFIENTQDGSVKCVQYVVLVILQFGHKG